MSKYLFSSRVDWDTEPNRISSLLERLHRKGEEVLDLTVSNPTKAGFLFSLEALREGMFQERITDYDPHPRGMPIAREAIAGYYEEHGVSIHPESIFCTAGTSEAYSMLFKLLAEPGDNILVPAPTYPLLWYLIHFESLKSISYYLKYIPGTGWRIDRDFITTTTSEHTKAVIVVNPNNPAGSYVVAEDREFLVDFCVQRGIALIVDEVFHDYCYLETQPPSFLAHESPCLLFVLNGFSKTLCLPQVKLSWYAISGPPDIKHEALARLDILHDSYLSVNIPVQVAAPILLREREDIQEAVRRRCRGNLAFLRSVMKSYDWVEVFPVEAGWSAVIRVWPMDDGEEFVLRLLKDYHVFVHPGYFYDFPDDLHLVVSLLPANEIFRAGVQKLAEAFDNL